MDRRAGATLIAAIAAAVTMAGCSVPPHQPQVVGEGPQFEREMRLRALWIGKPYAQLRRQMGPPRSELGLPGYDGTRHNIFVFGAVDPAAGCVDAYTVSIDDTGAETISDYHCR